MVPPDTPIEVGASLQLEERTVTVVGIRAKGSTWRRPGDRFVAGEVMRVYARREAMPPAGRSDWSRSREMPSSRTSSTSMSFRRRSSPGVRR